MRNIRRHIRRGRACSTATVAAFAFGLTALLLIALASQSRSPLSGLKNYRGSAIATKGTNSANTAKHPTATPELATASSIMATRQATMFVTHGGGPMPLLGKQPQLAAFLSNASALLPQRPKAIVCVTAHWETEDAISVSTNPSPPMLYDYGGFPDAAYKIKYPAPGHPELARRVMDLLRNAGLPVAEDSTRGFDHGTFVPLMLAFPKAEIPVVQVSLMSHLDPAKHIQMGQALQPLRDDNILIFASGSSYHNMRGFFAGGGRNAASVAFDNFLHKAVVESGPEERTKLLERWREAPSAVQSHPREEHLIPLMVAVGAAGSDAGALSDRGDMNGCVVSSFIFGGVGVQSA